MLKNRTTVLTRDLKTELKRLASLINKSRGVLVAGHTSPDGDCIASLLAMGYYLEKKGIRFAVVGCDPFPEAYSFLPRRDLYRNILEDPVNAPDYDLFITLDCGDRERLGKTAELVLPEHTLFNVDHHRGNKRFGHYNAVADNASSVGEILYYFFELDGFSLDTVPANLLYVSIVTDTGSFRYDLTHPGVHEIAARLLEKGVKPSEINVALYQSRKPGFMKLLGTALSRMQFHAMDRIAVSWLLKHDFEETGINETDGIVEYLGMSAPVSVYILIKEKDDGEWSASLRSKHDTDVSVVAGVFGGGGHRKASGCRTSNMGLEAFREKLLTETARHLSNP